ncbi:MAG: DoxX family protein [Deltaproteobacteria bacterium]|nr:DoxX family protein [Deltaproteobacteria bacterium]
MFLVLSVSILAGSFAWAAVLKLADPLSTLLDIQSYEILPGPLLPFAAAILPATELWAAFFLISGPRNFRLAAAFVLSALLVVFMAAAALGLARGLDFSCGCFGSDPDAAPEKPGVLFFLRDAFLLALGILIARENLPANPEAARPEADRREVDRPGEPAPRL